MKSYVWVMMLILSTSAIDHREKHQIKKNLLLRRLGISSLENSVIGEQAYQGAPSPLVSSALGSLAGAGPVNILGHDIHTTITRHLGVPFGQPYGVPVEQNSLLPFKVPVAVPVDRPFAVPVPDLIPVPVGHPFPGAVQPALPLVRQVGVSRPSPFRFEVAVPAAVARPVVRPHAPRPRPVTRLPYGWAGASEHAGSPHIY